MKTIVILAALLGLASPVIAQDYAPIILIDVSPPMATPMIPIQFPTPPQLFVPAPVYVSPFINGVIPAPSYVFQSSSYAVPYGSPQWVGF
jgi:hypothetical protein